MPVKFYYHTSETSNDVYSNLIFRITTYNFFGFIYVIYVVLLPKVIYTHKSHHICPIKWYKKCIYEKRKFSPEAWSSCGHLMNKDINHLFYYVPGSHGNNKIDVANHGNVAGIFWTPFSKWPPSKLHFLL